MTRAPDAPDPAPTEETSAEEPADTSQGPKLRDTLRALETRLGAIERSVTVLAEAELEKDRPRPRAISRSVSWLERHWATRLTFAVASLAALGAILFSAYQFEVEQEARAEERDARRAEAGFRRQAQLSAAWETLLQRVGGNTGKGGALELILEEQTSLSLVDLSCANIGTYLNGFCANPPVFDFGASDHFRPQPVPFGTSRGTGGEFLWPWQEGFLWPWQEADALPEPEIIIPDLPAERRKWLDGVNFSQTTMLNWWVINANFRDVNLSEVKARQWGLEEVDFHFSSTDLIAGFTCESCDFRLSNNVPWQFLTQLDRPHFPGSTLIFPHDTTVTREGEMVRLQAPSGGLDMIFESGLDGSTLMDEWWWNEMPLILKADAPRPEGRNPWGITEPLRTAPDKNIFWEFYDAQTMCLPAIEIFEEGITLPDDVRAHLEARHNIPVTTQSINDYYSDPDNNVEICGLTSAHPELRPFFEEYLLTAFVGREFPGIAANGDRVTLSFSCATDYDLSNTATQLPIDGCAERPWGGF